MRSSLVVRTSMHQLQRSWVRSQHPSAKWNLRGGRWSRADYSTKKIIPPTKCLKKIEVTGSTFHNKPEPTSELDLFERRTYSIRTCRCGWATSQEELLFHCRWVCANSRLPLSEPRPGGPSPDHWQGCKRRRCCPQSWKTDPERWPPLQGWGSQRWWTPGQDPAALSHSLAKKKIKVELIQPKISDADPWHFGTDPDPAIQDGDKKFFCFFAYYF